MIAERLRRWEFFFSHFSDELLEQLAACLSVSRFPAGVTLFKEGEDTREAYLLDRGGVRIQRHTSYGLFTIARLDEGEMFGETNFIDGQLRSGEAAVTAEAELFIFNPVALASVMEKDGRFHVALYWTFWKSLSKKLRETNEKLAQFFSEGGMPPGMEPEQAKSITGEFRIDLAAKRQLFREQKLSNLEINFLTSLSRERKLAPGQVLFQEGDEGNEMYVLLEGRVMISKYIPGAGEEALAFLERGDYFGEMALIDNQPRSANAKADDGGAVVLSISRDVLEGILDISKISSLRLLQLFCSLVAKRLRELDEKLIGWYILSGGGGASGEAPPGQ